MKVKRKVIGVAGRQSFPSRINFEGAGQDAFRQHGFWRAEPKRSSGIQKQDIVTRTCCHVQIMKRRDDCQGQVPDQLEHFELMSDVEVVCRLVQDQQARFLRKRTSDHDSLALAPRKGSQMSIGKAVQVQPFKRIANDPFVTRAVANCKSFSMRRAPEADDLPDGKREISRLFLQDGCNHSGNIPSRKRPDVFSIYKNGTAGRAVEAVKEPKKRCLPGAIRADNAQNAAGFECEARIVKNWRVTARRSPCHGVQVQ